MTDTKHYGRRNFLGDIAKAGIVGLVPFSKVSNQHFSQRAEDSLFATLPYLQNLSPTAVTIMWITSRPCISKVLYGTDSKQDQTAEATHNGLVDAYNFVNKIRIENLKPDTRYYYTISSREIKEFKPYSIEWGQELESVVFNFTTPEVHPQKVGWVVLNDIHDRPESFPLLFSLLEKHDYDFVYLNGDMFNYEVDEQQFMDHLLNPLGNILASRVPFLYARGNHETRGKFARHHFEFFDNPGQGNYFSFTQGPVHFVVLDTGEDKEDSHKEYSGLVSFDAYREKQAGWLEKEIETKAFQDARFRVVMMHIPPYQSGDWHGTLHCRQLFNPLFNKGKIDLLICGHTHKYGMYPADAQTHNYPLVIGGGPLDGKRTIMQINADKDFIDLRMIRDDGAQVGKLKIKSAKY